MRGQAQAISSNALTRTLEERGLLVLEVAESADAAATTSGVRFGRRREVLEVTRAMAALLPVGMPLAQALNAASGVASGDVRTALQEAGIEYDSAESSLVPTMTVPVDEDAARKVFKLIDALEDCDDVQNVYANFDVSDDVMALIDA